MDYEDALAFVRKNGRLKPDRTGTGTISTLGVTIRYDLEDSFPLITSKRVHVPSVIGELLWFLQTGKDGNMDAQWLRDRNINIWNSWKNEDGKLGPIYGAQWRNWNSEGLDQLAAVIDGIKADPYGRRHVVSAWNPGQLDQMALPPCHILFQFYVGTRNRLSLMVYQRSADMFLGVPFDLASYGFLLTIVADIVGLEPGELVWTGADCHIYLNHLEQVDEQLSRVSYMPALPQVKLVNPGESLEWWSTEAVIDSIEVRGYHPLPSIKGEVAV